MYVYIQIFESYLIDVQVTVDFRINQGFEAACSVFTKENIQFWSIY